MIESVCVFCASSGAVQPAYFDVAKQLGFELARQGYKLVYGGGDVGLMGELARAAHTANGQVVGILPRALNELEGVAYDIADELIITETMAERKSLLRDRSDAFVVLPGGLGTLEEFLEVLTLKQLGYHAKPIILINTGGIYDPLVRLFEHLYQERFLREHFFNLYHVVADAPGAMAFLK